jgi:serine/threonine protein kinase/formylglycine-generating enzyme required for sulfatase activity
MDAIAQLRAALAGRYEILREIGAGGMATVYLARDVRHDRSVAVKVLRQELAAALGSERFLRETRITAGLDHPHILTLIDSGEARAAEGEGAEQGILYYVLPYVRGESLRAKLDREKRLSMDEACRIAKQVASALAYAHRQGIVHRDIKPENILIHEGEAVVADFGIALAVGVGGGDRLTQTGLSPGTPAYMSVEQMAGEGTVDGRTDEYALASVLFEMLTGEPPYAGSGAVAMMARRATGAVPSARASRAEIPAALDAAIQKALAPAAEQRYKTVAEFGDAVEHAVAPRETEPRRRMVSVVAFAVAIMAIAGSWLFWQSLQRERARSSVAKVAQLASERRFPEAYVLATRAGRQLPGDTALARLLALVTDHVTVVTEPPGARVSLQRFAADGRSLPAVSAGITPIANLPMARGDYRVVIEKDGFVPVERIASSAFARAELRYRPDSATLIHVALSPPDKASAGMVRVEGGVHTLLSPDAPPGSEAKLGAFLIDKFEVTNEEYKQFVQAGAYTNAQLWKHSFQERGKPLSAGDAARRFVDKTGLSAPRGWNSQEFPNGLARHPVTDVTWYEAEAFCEWEEKELPTLFQWEQAARGSAQPHVEELMMPWGAAAPRDPATYRANFGTTGTTPVGSYPFGISPYGAYDMAGNVKEWTRTPVEQGFAATGGSYEDPIYVFSPYAFYDGFTSSRSLGFRCARTLGKAGQSVTAGRVVAPSATGSAGGDQGASPLKLDRRTPIYHPVSEAVFRSMLTRYEYDHRPLQARVLERTEAPDWIREKVQWLAPNNDTVFAYLFLPRHVEAPYQTIVFVPSRGAFFGHTAAEEAEAFLGPHIKAGRAVWVTVFKGMIGREWEPNHPEALTNSVQFRDEMVYRATELRTGLDYLETRQDIDRTRLAYYGFSWGSGSRLIFAGVDGRYRTIVFVGGAIDWRMQPTLPEANNVNFAAWIKQPKLLLNGKNDEESVWLTQALPLWNLLREPKKLVLVDGAGHIPPAEERVPPINAWLDSTMGPVRRAK